MKVIREHRHLWKSYLQFATKLRIKRVMGTATALWLALEQKDGWHKTSSWIEKIKSDKTRMEVAGGFATFYLWNGKLTDAREATDYWLQLATEWIQAHPTEAMQAARIHQHSAFWYPYGFPNLVSAEVQERNTPISFTKGETKLAWQALQLDQGIVVEWRDARLVSELVDWMMGKSLLGEPIWKHPPRKEETAPITMSYDSVHFPRFFVAAAGIPHSDFKRMWRKASNLEDLQQIKQEHGTGL
ncbi:hypothetical protein EON83_28075 [bacterium]|nr:MAG: hypothetical protein EON83_28075 [bacterium]